MSIEKTSYGTYRVRWRDQDGQSKARSFKKLQLARDFEKATLHEVRAGTYVDAKAGAVSLENWAETWLRASMHLGPGGRETYRRDLDGHILPELGDTHLAKLTPDMISEYLADELDEGQAPSSVHRHYRTLNTMLKVAIANGKLARNPCDPVKPPKVDSAEMLFLTAGQVQLLADTITSRYRAWVLLAAYSGVRWSEAVGLRRGDIDGDRVTITGQLKRRADGWQRSAPKTKAGRRTITIPAGIATELDAHLEEFSGAGPDGILFPNQHGSPVGVSSFTGNVFKPALVRAGIEVVEKDDRMRTSRVRIHDLRHTSVALAVQAGAHPKSIQARMGHASIQVTLDRYGHLFPDIDERLAESLDVIFKASSPS